MTLLLDICLETQVKSLQGAVICSNFQNLDKLRKGMKYDKIVNWVTSTKDSGTQAQ